MFDAGLISDVQRRLGHHAPVRHRRGLHPLMRERHEEGGSDSSDTSLPTV